MTSCSENPLSKFCTCSSKYGLSTNSKLFDYATQQYVCCGKIGYNLAGVVNGNTNNNLIAGAASMDDTRCANWWTSSVDPTQQQTVTGAGPSQSKIDAAQHQLNISRIFPPASIDGKTNTYSCDGKVSTLSSLHTVPRYVSFRNPNGGENYVEEVVCVPHDDTTTNAPYSFINNNPINTAEEFAIFKIDGCTNLNSTTCIATNGVDTPSIGDLEYSSSIYNGSKYHNHNNNDNNINYNMSWIVIFCLIAFVIICIIFIVWLAMKLRRRKRVETYEVRNTAAPMTYVERTTTIAPAVPPPVQNFYRSTSTTTTTDPINGFAGGNYYVSDKAGRNVLDKF